MPLHEKPWYLPALEALLLQDIPSQLELSPAEFDRDFRTLCRRLTTEGESFLTKTLPAFGKEIDLALQGRSPLACRAFSKARRSARPAFLQALTKRVFKDDGWVMDEPCPVAIRALRMVCHGLKKIEKGFSDESLRMAIADFQAVDASLPDRFPMPTRRALGTGRATVQALFQNSGMGVCLRPRHGPGAVAGREGVVGKRSASHCYSDLERYFPARQQFFSLRDLAENYKLITGRIKCKFGLSRTEFVEKDSSGPRTIGLEPAEYMWAQQSLKSWLYNHVESHPLTRGRVNFTDQSINRQLTANWQDWDTLDMSKASDRNSLALVKELFQDTWILPYLLASRTPGTVLPNGEILWFKKFAPMGSATCFPVQALVYFALAVASLHRQGMPYLLALQRVYVYGDDLVVPHGFFDGINADFESVGLKFNMAKCCISGKFRESCGMDAFDGVDVTPQRLKRPHHERRSADLIPLVEYANTLMKSGYWAAARAFRGEVLKQKCFRKYQLPVTDRLDLPVLSWLDYESGSLRFSMRNGVFKVKGWVFEPTTVQGDPAAEARYLFEYLSQRGPVGERVRLKGRMRRTFSLRYRGELRKRAVVVNPYGPTFPWFRGQVQGETAIQTFIREGAEKQDRLLATWVMCRQYRAANAV